MNINLKLLKRPDFVFTQLLLVYTMITIGFNFQIYIIKSFMLIMILFLISNFIISKLNIKSTYISSIISALLIFLILDPSHNYITLLFLSIAYTIAKYVRFKKMPIFNTGALAIMILYVFSLIFNFVEEPFVSWWGSAYSGSLSILFLLPILLYTIIKFKKYNMFIPLFITFISLDMIVNGISFFNITTGTIYFALGIMFLEIKTSPTTKFDQIIFGFIGALLLVGANSLLSYPILISILILNLLVFCKKEYNYNKIKDSNRL